MKRLAFSTAILAASFALIPQHTQAQRHSDIVDVARDAGQFGTLLAALDAAGLTHTIADGGPFTVLAPTDEAFERLPAGTVEELLRPENRGQLQAILQYHVISGRVEAAQVKNLRSAETLLGQRVAITHEGGSIIINEARVTTADIGASNGVIHVIDAVLLPEEMSSGQQAAMDLMEFAIMRGAPLYNAGHHGACAAVYETAALALLRMGEDVPERAMRQLRESFRASQRTHDMSERAWMLRGAFDETMRQMRTGME